MSKTESNIAIFLLYLFLFLAAGMSYVTSERVAALDEKIQLRDSLMMRTQKYVERRDSMMFEYIDKVQSLAQPHDTIVIYRYIKK